MGNLLSGKKHAPERKEGITGQPFARALYGAKSHSILSHREFFKETQFVTHEFPQPSQQKPEIEMILSRKDTWRSQV